MKHIEVVAKDAYVFYRAKCEPEMRSSPNYKLKLAVKVRPCEVDSEEGVADREVSVLFMQNACHALLEKHLVLAASMWQRCSLHWKSSAGWGMPETHSPALTFAGVEQAPQAQVRTGEGF